MFAGFNVNIDMDRLLKLDDYNKIGKKLYANQRETVRRGLKKYIYEDRETLNATIMQEDWFPSVKSDIFLSHSHGDEQKIISLAGWLYKEFGLTAFIDSCVWGYANDLLKVLDEEYSVKEKTIESTTYNYNKTIISSSHVHMMISMALAKMIDKTECLFFINTPNSISVSKKIKEKHMTLSPWIYAELQISEIVRRQNLKIYRGFSPLLEHNAKDDFAEKELKMGYKVYLGHLIDINESDFSLWETTHKNYAYALDALYVSTGLLNEEIASNGK